MSRDFHKVPQNGTEFLFYNFDILHDDQSSVENSGSVRIEMKKYKIGQHFNYAIT